MQIGEPGYFMVLVGPCVDHFIKFPKKVISVKMGHGTYHQGVLKKKISRDPLRGVERKIALKFENAFVKAQFFKLFAKIIVRLGLTIICPPPFLLI